MTAQLQLEELKGLLQEIADDGGPEAVEEFASRIEDPDDLALLEIAAADLSSDHWRADPGRMMFHLTKGDRKLWRFVKFLSGKFREAVEGTSPFQIWNVPAQYGKSTLASQWGPAWCLDRHPDWPLILTSYGDELANRNATAVRDILRDHSDELRCQLRRDQQRQDRFTTREGGGVLAAGIDAGITGWPAKGIVVDDPFKHWQEAHSEQRRKHVWNQYLSVLRLRLAEGGFIIVVQTRWHEEDLTGMLLAHAAAETGDNFELVRLPAVAEEDDLLGRAPGEVLEPERYSLDAVLARKRALGSYLWTGMEQQRPSPEEGGEFKRSWWKLEDSPPPRFDQVITSWDMKLKDKESGSFVVGQFWGRVASSFWCCDQLRGQWNQATTENAITLMAVRHPEVSTHCIENTGNGPEVMEGLRAPHPDYVVSDEIAGLLGMTEAEREAVQSLRRRGMSGLVPIKVKGPKPVRARANQGYIEAGDVHLAPQTAPWVAVFVDEHAAFPNGAHDDIVDATSQGISQLAKRGTGTAKSAADVRTEKVMPGRGMVGDLRVRPRPR